jgi:hypothetical protein
LGGKFIYEIKVLLGYQRTPGPKRRPNILWREASKEVKDSMKVEDGGVHHKRYDGCYTKQQVKIPKAI